MAASSCFILLLFALFLQSKSIVDSLACKDPLFSNPISEWDRNLTYNWGALSDYRLIRKVGAGAFGSVYLGVNVNTFEKVVVKIFTDKRGKKERHRMKEIAILHDVCGGPNIVKLVDILHTSKDPNSPIMVFDYAQQSLNDAHLLYPLLSDHDVRFYMFELLKAIAFLHDHRGIMHRDLKPDNIIINHAKRKLTLIDVGISKYYIEGNDFLSSTHHSLITSRMIRYNITKQNPLYNKVLSSILCFFSCTLYASMSLCHTLN